jgi:hypothetical protein
MLQIKSRAQSISGLGVAAVLAGIFCLKAADASEIYDPTKDTANQPVTAQSDEAERNRADDQIPHKLSRILLIVQCSRAMQERCGSYGSAFEYARNSVKKLLKAVPNEVDFAMRIIGGTKGGGGLIPEDESASTLNVAKNNDCRSSVLIVPFGQKNNRLLINQALQHMGLSGRSALAYVIAQAYTKDLNPETLDNGQTMIILICQGLDSCMGDPCQLTRSLARANPKLAPLYILQVSDKPRNVSGFNQLNCIAQASQGRYYSYEQLSSLLLDLQTAAKPAASADP